MTPSSDESRLHYRGWRLVAVCFAAAFFAWSSVMYGQSIYLAELQRLHGWSPARLSGASTLCYLVGALLVVFTAESVARLGPQRFLGLGVTALAMALTALGQVQALWQIYPVYMLMAVGWACMGVAAITTLTSLWFSAKRGLAVSTALIGSSCGGMLGASTILAAIERYGFATALTGVAVLMLVVMVPLIALWGHGPQRTNASGTAPAAALPTASTWTRPRALRSPQFLSVALPFAVVMFVHIGMLVHLVSMLEPLAGRYWAGMSITVLATASVTGRFALGPFIDRLNVRAVAAVSILSQAAALVLFAISREPLVLVGACALFGLSFGTLVLFPALIFQREFEPRAFALLVGLSTAMGQLTYATGPGVLGLLREATGSYTAGLVLCTTLMVAAAWVLHRPPRWARPHVTVHTAPASAPLPAPSTAQPLPSPTTQHTASTPVPAAPLTRHIA